MGAFDDTGDDPAARYAAAGRDLAEIDRIVGAIEVCVSEGDQRRADDIAAVRAVMRSLWNTANAACVASAEQVDSSVVGYPPP